MRQPADVCSVGGIGVAVVVARVRAGVWRFLAVVKRGARAYRPQRLRCTAVPSTHDNTEHCRVYRPLPGHCGILHSTRPPTPARSPFRRLRRQGACVHSARTCQTTLASVARRRVCTIDPEGGPLVRACVAGIAVQDRAGPRLCCGYAVVVGHGGAWRSRGREVRLLIEVGRCILV